MELHGFKNGLICNSEAIGLANCLNAYAENNCTDIFEIGFNEDSGYTYIALEDNITICSYLGQTVQYLVTDFDNGEEFSFNNYTDAINKLNTL